MKKIVALVLVLVLAFGLLAGCGDEKEPEKQEAPAAQTGQEVDYSNVKIGLLLNSTKVDGAWSQAVAESLMRSKEELNLSDDQILIVESVPEGSAECDSTIMQLIDEGCNLIFGASSSFLTNINNAYPQHPDVYFAQFEGKNDANCCSYTLWDIEGMFMCGYAGALMSEGDELGFVANQPQASIIRAINAYACGARAANPDATVRVVWSNSWYDLAADKECAEALMQLGITSIGNVSTVAVLQACESGGAYTNGYYVDLQEFAPKATLTSFVWNFAPIMNEIITEVATGTWTSETKYAGMAEGAAMLAPWNTDSMPQEVIDQCDEMYERIVNGDYVVMEGPLVDNEGQEVLPAGETFTLEELMVCDFLLDNVIGTLP